MIQQHLLKEQAEEQLLSKSGSGAFQQIDSANSHIQWEEEGKEFYLDGQLYDVAKKETHNGKTILYCINDAKEEQLVKQLLKDISSRSDQTGNKDGKHNGGPVVQDFTIPAEAAMPDVAAGAANKYAEYLCSTINVTREVNTPPPDKMHFFKI